MIPDIFISMPFLLTQLPSKADGNNIHSWLAMEEKDFGVYCSPSRQINFHGWQSMLNG